VQTAVDLRPEQDVIVRINAGLDMASGVLTWRFESIDPATGLPPADPVTGFLPPNRSPPEGEGSVSFTVRPKPGLATGTEIRNRATIVFDVNPGIDTPEWLNTIDDTRPASFVLPLAAEHPSPSFEVRWAGTDEGAGVRDYTIYVSENGGAFTPWLSHTPATSATFTGRHGAGYRFYSVATDGVGHLEPAPDRPDAATHVLVATTTSITQGGGSGARRARALESVSVPRSIAVRRLRRRGLPLVVTVGAPRTRVTGTLVVTRGRLRGRRARIVARFTRANLAPGRHALRIRLSRVGARRLRAMRATELRLRLAASAPGSDAIRVARKVRLRR
jgi:hypothetical protein